MSRGTFTTGGGKVFFARRYESGDFFASVAEPGWQLHEGEGQRTHASAIRFARGFATAPRVVLGVSGLDTEKHTPTRGST
jgi:hypothetical protein